MSIKINISTKKNEAEFKKYSPRAAERAHSLCRLQNSH